jgi:hypothetical protein
VLRTIATVLESVSGQPALFPALEAPLLPLLRRFLSTDGQDVIEELAQVRPGRVGLCLCGDALSL